MTMDSLQEVLDIGPAETPLDTVSRSLSTPRQFKSKEQRDIRHRPVV